jgi:hypothetical protein
MPSLRESTVKSWSELLSLLDRLSTRSPNEVTYLFRGQVDKGWRLVPTLLRVGTGQTIQQVLRSEAYALHACRSNVIRFTRQEDLPPHLPKQPIAEWWAYMQHHGAPTRLIDFTASPYVALYFTADTAWDRDGCMYILHRGPIEAYAKSSDAPVNNIDFDKYLQSESSKEAMRVYIPYRQTERLAAQQGLFIYTDNVMTDLESLLERIFDKMRSANEDAVLYNKVIIPASIKKECMIRLRAMNISAQTLFPGIDGLGRYISDALRTGLMM